MENPSSQVPSSRIARYAAYLVDGIVLGIPYLLIDFLFKGNVGVLLAAILIVGYNMFFIYKYGQTVGKKFMGLKVISTRSEKLTLFQVFLREVIGRVVSSLFFNLGYLWILWDKRRQGWHDKIAGTRVLQVEPATRTKKVLAYSTLVLLFGLAIGGIILAVLLVGLNPSKQFSQSNNVKRRSDVNAIATAVYVEAATRGTFAGMGIEEDGVYHNISRNDVDLCSHLIPGVMVTLPVDPIVSPSSLAEEDCSADYNTGYQVKLEEGKITVSAPNAEKGEEISATR